MDGWTYKQIDRCYFNIIFRGNLIAESEALAEKNFKNVRQLLTWT